MKVQIQKKCNGAWETQEKLDIPKPTSRSHHRRMEEISEHCGLVGMAFDSSCHNFISPSGARYRIVYTK